MRQIILVAGEDGEHGAVYSSAPGDVTRFSVANRVKLARAQNVRKPRAPRHVPTFKQRDHNDALDGALIAVHAITHGGAYRALSDRATFAVIARTESITYKRARARKRLQRALLHQQAGRNAAFSAGTVIAQPREPRIAVRDIEGHVHSRNGKRIVVRSLPKRYGKI